MKSGGVVTVCKAPGVDMRGQYFRTTEISA
jgi:hypothetical protein